MKKISIVLTIILFLSGCAATNKPKTVESVVTEGVIEYECYDFFDHDKDKILIITFAEVSNNQGAIGVFGEIVDAHYQRDGFTHRWDFDNNQFAFVITPNGNGTYYDFTKEQESVEGSMFFKCESP